MNLPALSLVFHQLPRGAGGTTGAVVSQAQDTLAAAAGIVRDTLRPVPLPGGVAAFVRFVFQVPQWIQIGGAVLAVLVAAWIVRLAWVRRREIWHWLVTRSRGIQLAMGGSVFAVVVVAVFAGATSWNYIQNNNGFCTGCHIMERPFGRFQVGAGKHENLRCHDCHEQSMYANIRQLVLWVAERPSMIGPHAKVPNERCEHCHQVVGSEEPWRHVLQLAGHKAHFESDSAPLKDLQCVTCHGAEIHHFVPSVRTCQQSGCHAGQSVRLAGMAALPTINCVTCHAFTADLPALATHDSAVRALIPSQRQCLSCHGMQGRPPGYVLAKDPHQGECGLCHDVHADTRPSDAAARCPTCHTNLDRTAFHSGANHRAVAKDCLLCHNPHAASLDASDCVGCHTAVQQRGKFHPPLPFDTSAVVHRGISLLPAAGRRPAVPLAPLIDRLPQHDGKGDATPAALPAMRDSPAAWPVRPLLDTFQHALHKSLPCLTCHTVNKPDTPYGLVFEVPRGCDLCHHQAFFRGAMSPQQCTRCHQGAVATPRPTTVAIRVDDRAPVPRTVAFRHEVHQQLACTTCHQPPNILPPDSVRSCQACHAQHHDAARNCSACHNLPGIPAAHSRTTHTGCNDCHTTAHIAELVPNRNFCLVCHAAQRNHQPGGECTACHFLKTPAEYRPALLARGAP